MHKFGRINRRDALYLGLTGILASGALHVPQSRAAGTINFADIGVGDPGGDWSKYTAATGYGVNLVSMGNAPSAVLNVLVAGGGQGTYDIINIVGGMQKPLVENDLVEDDRHLAHTELEQRHLYRRVPWQGKAGIPVHRLNDKIYGVPTVLQGDSFAYLPEKTGPLDSYAALFDPKWKGYVALEDNYTTAGQKTASISKRPALRPSTIPMT